MLFNSLQFVYFFIIVTSLYFILPHKFRWALLLMSSCYFYMAYIPVYILILGFTIVIDYFAGIYLEEKKGKSRKLFLILSLVANIGILCIFKYYNFINENLSLLLGTFSVNNPIPYLKILLPIGLSFHTFQAMSYTIEVYRGSQKAERNFGIYALYVMFYPQLVAGPIERPQNLLHQFYEKHQFNYARIVDGLKQMLKGFVKKVVIADRVAIYVDTIYSTSDIQSGKTLACAAFFFAFQIYCDFSAYSDIAIGSARVMGFDLMSNFNTPFFSRSVTDFWRRWHMSLTTWFNDYLFTPITISKRDWGKYAVVFALLVTFFISGLWHGAAWTFVLFGVFNGMAVTLEFLTKKIRKKLFKSLPQPLVETVGITLTFLFACFTWVFFRAKSVGQATDILKTIAKFKGPLYVGYPKDNFYYSILFIFLVLLYEFKEEFFKTTVKLFHNNNMALRYLCYVIAIVLILLFGVFNGGQFIYFQF